MPHPDPAAPLLDADEPPPFTIVNPAGPAPLVFTGDHAGNRFPRACGTLGLPAPRLGEHIAWDIGAAEVARLLAARFDAPLVLSAYSRLVIDCNRTLDDPSSIAAESDGVDIPGNRGLDPAERRRRAEALFFPYHDAIAAIVAAKERAGRAPALISIHSFTPVYQAAARPWQVAVLWNEDDRLAAPALAAFRRDRTLVVGDNEPYSGRDGVGYTIVEHAEKAGRLHILFEVRQDLIATPAGAGRWAGIVGDALAEACAAAGLAL